jgi:hypothetical protein
MFEAAQQSVKGRNNIVVTRSILNQVGERCQGVKERSESLKKHMEKVMNEDNERDGIADANCVQESTDKVTEGEVMEQ